jgi:hypothetical protein
MLRTGGISSVIVRKCLHIASNWDTSFHFPSDYLPILRSHTPKSSDSWQRVNRKVCNSAPRFQQFLEHWHYYVTLLQLMCCDWHYYHWLFLRFVHEQKIRSGSTPARGRVSALAAYTRSCEIRFSHTRYSPTNLHQLCRYGVLSLTWHYRKAFDFSLDVKCRKQSRDNWAIVTTAWRVLRLRMEERPPVRRVAASIWISSRRQPTKGMSFSLWGRAKC